MTTELHEAGHQCVAAALGRTLKGVTAASGTHLAGCARSVVRPVPEVVWGLVNVEQPFCLWPSEVRSGLEDDVLVWIAGDLASLLLAPPKSGRQVPTIVERAAAEVEQLVATAPEPSQAELAALCVIVDTPGLSDADQIARTAWMTHGRDLASANAWLGYLEAQCRAVIATQAGNIQAVARALALRRTLSGEQVAALLRA